LNFPENSELIDYYSDSFRIFKKLTFMLGKWFPGPWEDKKGPNLIQKAEFFMGHRRTFRVKRGFFSKKAAKPARFHSQCARAWHRGFNIAPGIPFNASQMRTNPLAISSSRTRRPALNPTWRMVLVVVAWPEPASRTSKPLIRRVTQTEKGSDPHR
jgi:hypothetical protein